VTEAFLWGLFAASSLVLGALVVWVHAPHERALGLVMGFGSGVLLSAVSFELVEEAVRTSGGLRGTAGGFFVGHRRRADLRRCAGDRPRRGARRHPGDRGARAHAAAER
jgi:hypothetical protein